MVCSVTRQFSLLDRPVASGFLSASLPLPWCFRTGCSSPDSCATGVHVREELPGASVTFKGEGNLFPCHEEFIMFLIVLTCPAGGAVQGIFTSARDAGTTSVTKPTLSEAEREEEVAPIQGSG